MTIPNGIRPPQPPTPETLSYFTAIPWCAKLLSDTTYAPMATPSRAPKHSTEDSLLLTSLNAPDTVHDRKSLYRRAPLVETITLFRLGSGVNGHAGVVHGGMIAVLMDEAMGHATSLERPAAKGTAYLNTTFRRPVPTPGVVLCRTKIERVEGRKHWVEGTMGGGSGDVYVTAQALFIEATPKI